jgi:hypothetical protein
MSDSENRPAYGSPAPSHVTNGNLFQPVQNYWPSKKRVGPRPIVGNSKPCCGGCCIFAHDSYVGFILAAALLTPIGIHVSSVVPRTEWWSFVIEGVLTVWALLMQFFASACDPGIIPGRPETAPPPDPEECVLADGSRVTLKICPTCNINRPPRSSHCHGCDYCVEEYDHHCGVVGSCVAKRTFRFFVLYFYAVVILSLYVFIRSVVFLSMNDLKKLMEGSDFQRWQVIAALGCTLYSACAGTCVLGQMVMYTSLACSNMTQKVQAQRKRAAEAEASGLPSSTTLVYDNERRVGNISCFSCLHRLFGPMPPSKLKGLEL